jgi:cytochrome c
MRAGMTTSGRKLGKGTVKLSPFPASARLGIAALCRMKTGSGGPWVGLLSRRFNHISFELSAKIGFSPRPKPPARGMGMSSFEWNKIIGAILASMILAMVSGIIASNLVKPTIPAKPAYVVAAANQPAPGPQAAAPASAGPEPIGPLLAKADPKAGQEQTRICQVCHTFDKGGPNRIGPNLYEVVGGPIAEDRNGYQFSDALSKHKGDKWTVDNLNKWLWKPQSFAEGTKMTFAGLANAQDRANVVAYLNSLSDHPQPLGGK